MMADPTAASVDPVELASQVGAAMFAADRASRETLGMTLVKCTPGGAVMSMTVGEVHLNGHQI
jgi:acyl-CoA thioesterase